MKVSPKIEHGEDFLFSLFGDHLFFGLVLCNNFVIQDICDFSLDIKGFQYHLTIVFLFIVYSTLLTNIIRSSFTIIGIRSYLAGVC